MNGRYYNTGKDSFGRYLELTVENEFGDIVSQRKVYYPLIEYHTDDKTFFLQYDDNMGLVYDACNYLNCFIKSASYKTRLFRARVLRNYLCFMKLSEYDHSDLSNRTVIERLISFFREEDYRSADSQRARSSRTVNEYMNVIRDFARFKGIDSIIVERNSLSPFVDLADAMAYASKTYPSSMTNNPHSKDFIMPYISPEEFVALRSIAIGKKDTQALMLFHLMYFYGLRIGECLGLTEEDFEIRQKHYSPSPTILLRNRLSDKPFQYVKMLYHPQTAADYKAKKYPHQKVLLSMQFYEKIAVFIENTSKELEKRKIRERSVADTISSKYEKGENHYIFVNKYGRPLTQAAWNFRLKQYFIAAKLPIDTGVKRDNLNHRFRHGCAMYYLRFAEKGQRMTVEQVGHLLRHTTMSSVYSYLNMTLDDEFMLKQRFQDDLLKEIPNLE